MPSGITLLLEVTFSLLIFASRFRDFLSPGRHYKLFQVKDLHILKCLPFSQDSWISSNC